MSPQEHTAQLLKAQDRFIDAWGRMGSVWGISRTMAEVHALLFVTGEPMCMDDIMDRLRISRGNASMSLRALLEWGVVSKAPRRGERRDYYQAEQDVWSMFRAILRERVKREVEPLIESISEVRELNPSDEQDAHESARELDQRLRDMQEVFQLVATLGERFTGPSGQGLKVAAKLLAKTPGAGRSRAGA
jgi:DNA-binding transcriptional regulator GbsR (MarR family)